MTDTSFEIRPWGRFDIIGSFNIGEVQVVVKKITVTPGKRLSYQSHASRSEHWYIIAGQGEVELEGNTQTVKAGDSIDIKVGQKHRIGAGSEELIFVEVATGTFDEHDIVRYEDDFGRSA
jgi:mannose-6-phosphate isomerase-like protein (cupin superfamily)